MSARPDVRQMASGSAAASGVGVPVGVPVVVGGGQTGPATVAAAAAQHHLYMQRSQMNQALNPRSNSSTGAYLSPVDVSSASKLRVTQAQSASQAPALSISAVNNVAAAAALRQQQQNAAVANYASAYASAVARASQQQQGQPVSQSGSSVPSTAASVAAAQQQEHMRQVYAVAAGYPGMPYAHQIAAANYVRGAALDHHRGSSSSSPSTSSAPRLTSASTVVTSAAAAAALANASRHQQQSYSSSRPLMFPHAAHAMGYHGHGTASAASAASAHHHYQLQEHRRHSSMTSYLLTPPPSAPPPPASSSVASAPAVATWGTRRGSADMTSAMSMASQQQHPQNQHQHYRQHYSAPPYCAQQQQPTMEQRIAAAAAASAATTLALASAATSLAMTSASSAPPRPTMSMAQSSSMLAASRMARESSSTSALMKSGDSSGYGGASVSGLHGLPSQAMAAAMAGAIGLPPSSLLDAAAVPKRPRLELTPQQQQQTSKPVMTTAAAATVQTTATAPHLHPAPAVATPLRIDTREAVKESGYHPQVEAISPTGPDAPAERDDIRSTKDDLLQKISKVDREIAKAESQIAKLKKKQTELEEAALRPVSDSNDETEEERAPKNQCIAQIAYAENRKRAHQSHMSLAKCAPQNDLPLYNQPSDTDIYHENRRNHTLIKKRLVDFLKREHEQAEARERYLAETYTRLYTNWQKKVERAEASKKRKEREAKARELYERVFPELKKQREDKERDHRLGSRGAVRSEADMEDVIASLQEQEMEDKKMHSYAVIPPILAPPEERRRKFTDNNGLVQDPLKEYNERKFLDTWTDAEKEIFKEKYLLHPKNFGQIAQALERKTVPDCVQYYYLSKKTENYKQLMRRSKVTRRGKRGAAAAAADAAAAAAAAAAIGVVTRNRKEQSEFKMEKDDSNRSTPQPGSARLIKEEPKGDDEDDKRRIKTGNNHNENDSSDDENPPAKGGVAKCPVPTCNTTKSRVKGKLRHLPKKWSILPKDPKEAISNELQLPSGLKKCCTACFARINRRITQLTGGSNSPAEVSRPGSEADSLAAAAALSFSDEEVDLIRAALRNVGKNWNAVADKLPDKTPEQCKKFFYTNRKKYGLDKMVVEYKRSIQSGDQPPVMSSDEESGSSTSSCEGDERMQNNSNSGGSAHQSGRSSPRIKTEAKPIVQPIKTEQQPIKTEIKVEDLSAPVNNAQRLTGLPGGKEEDYDSSATMSADEREPMDLPGSRLTLAPAPGYPGHMQGYSRPGFPGQQSRLLQGPPGAYGIPPQQQQQQQQPPPAMRPPLNNGNKDQVVTVRDLMINVIERSLSTGGGSQQAPPQMSMQAHLRGVDAKMPLAAHSPHMMAASVSPTIHTLLEHSDPAPKATAAQQAQFRNALCPKPALPPPSMPSSGAPMPGGASADCETLDLSMPRKREASTPPVSLTSQSSSSYREPLSHHPLAAPRGSPARLPEDRQSAPPPAHSGSKVKTNPEAYFRSAQSPVIYSSDGRPVVDHLGVPVHRTSASPTALTHPRSASTGSAAVAPPPGRGPPQPQQPYLQARPHAVLMGAPMTAKAGPAPSSVSPKLSSARPPNMGGYMSGSITQGTPVINQARGYDALVKMGPLAADKAGSITHGTPMYDKRLVDAAGRPFDSRAMADYYHRSRSSTVSPSGFPPYPSSSSASSAASLQQAQQQQRPASYGSEAHLSSRQVIMNDYAIARSNEMQRRPDSREQMRSLSPPRLSSRDPSPRPRGQIDIRRELRPPDARFDPRTMLPDHRGDPKADLRAIGGSSSQASASSADLRISAHDPRLALDPRFRLDPRGAAFDSRPELRIIPQEHRGGGGGGPPSSHDPRSMLPSTATATSIDLRGARAMSGYYGPQSLYIGHDGKYVSSSALRDLSSRSPPRTTLSATPPPQRAATVIQRMAAPTGGSITSGKPVMAPRAAGPATLAMGPGHREVEIYKAANPEVTISKTSSPRQHAYTEHMPMSLASLVDVAVQQPKLPDPKEREMATLSLASSARHFDRPPLSFPGGAQAHALDVSRVPATTASASASSASQIVQQVQSERAKHMYLMQEKERIERGEFKPSAASASTPPSSTPSNPSPAPAERSGTLTAASLIDAIITHSINKTPATTEPAPMPGPNKFRRSPAEMAAATPQEDAAAARSPLKVTSRSPSLKGDTNGPDTVESEPNSRSGSPPKATDHKAPSPVTTAAQDVLSVVGAEQHWKRRGLPPTVPTTASATAAPPRPVVMTAPRTTAASLMPSADERQITRVAQEAAASASASAITPLAVSTGASKPAAVLEPISPPISAIEKPVTSSASAPSASNPADTAPPTAPGLSPLDYVKNKIMEEMKKGESGSAQPGSPPSATPTAAPLATPTVNGAVTVGAKRPHEETSSSSDAAVVTPEAPKKKAKDSTELPDSPDSGQMVIDESVSAASPQVSSPAPPPAATAEPPTATASAGSGPPAATKPTQPTYEPLSDDE